MTIIIVAKDNNGNETVVAHAPNFTEARNWLQERAITKSRINSKRWDIYEERTITELHINLGRSDVYGESYLESLDTENIAEHIAGEPNTLRVFPGQINHFVLRNIGEVEGNPEDLLTLPPYPYISFNSNDPLPLEWAIVASAPVPETGETPESIVDTVDTETPTTEPVVEPENTPVASENLVLLYGVTPAGTRHPIRVFGNQNTAETWLNENGLTQNPDIPGRYDRADLMDLSQHFELFGQMLLPAPLRIALSTGATDPVIYSSLHVVPIIVGETIQF